ncbi:MAG: hypothetical protein LBE09_05225 [Christensenellaceae bacterium]|jgi:FKBP-type peptidyl-prolyl cis-trans isomerase (trigger factor)|nr:hypothetical protein [Christensenellaceae bacterium]
MKYDVKHIPEEYLLDVYVEASVDETNAFIKEIYDKTKHEVLVPGFRPGMAPRKQFIKAYGEKDFLQCIAEKHVMLMCIEHLDADEYRNLILGSTEFTTPSIRDARFTDAGEFTCHVIIHIHTPIDLDNLLRNIDIDEASITYKSVEELTDDSLSDKAEHHRNLRKPIQTKLVTEDSIVSLSVLLYTPNGALLSGFEKIDIEMSYSMSNKKEIFPDLHQLLIGKDVNDSFKTYVKLTPEMVVYLRENKYYIFTAYAIGTEFPISVTIKKILGFKHHKIDDVFARQFTEFNTIDELRNNIYKLMYISTKMNRHNELYAHIRSAMLQQLLQSSKFTPYILDKAVEHYYKDVSILSSYCMLNPNQIEYLDPIEALSEGKYQSVQTLILDLLLDMQLDRDYSFDALMEIELTFNILNWVLEKRFWVANSQTLISEVDELVDKVLNAAYDINVMIDDGDPLDPDYSQIGLSYAVDVKHLVWKFALAHNQTSFWPEMQTDETYLARSRIRRLIYRKNKIDSQKLSNKV